MMSPDLLASFLLRCLLLNYAILFIWFFAIVIARNHVYSLHRRWFPMTNEEYVKTHYTLMGQYKIAILLLNLVPYLALVMV